MIKQKMTKTEMANLKAKGWEFIPWGPDEWNWAKVKDGQVIAQGCEPVFFEDMKSC